MNFNNNLKKCFKDEHYWERRRKNNLAAKRSREKRRLNDIVLETKVLELTNANNALKLKLELCMRKCSMTDEEVDRLFEENRHLLVVQESLDMSELLGHDDSLCATNMRDDDNDDNECHMSNFSASPASSQNNTSQHKVSSIEKTLTTGTNNASELALNSTRGENVSSGATSATISSNSSQHLSSSASSSSGSSILSGHGLDGETEENDDVEIAANIEDHVDDEDEQQHDHNNEDDEDDDSNNNHLDNLVVDENALEDMSECFFFNFFTNQRNE